MAHASDRNDAHCSVIICKNKIFQYALPRLVNRPCSFRTVQLRTAVRGLGAGWQEPAGDMMTLNTSRARLARGWQIDSKP